MVNGLKSLTTSAKNSILDARLGSEYVSASFFPGTFYIILAKEVSPGKKGELNEFLQMFGETSPNEPLLLPLISLNKEIK